MVLEIYLVVSDKVVQSFFLQIVYQYNDGVTNLEASLGDYAKNGHMMEINFITNNGITQSMVGSSYGHKEMFK